MPQLGPPLLSAALLRKLIQSMPVSNVHPGIRLTPQRSNLRPRAPHTGRACAILYVYLHVIRMGHDSCWFSRPVYPNFCPHLQSHAVPYRQVGPPFSFPHHTWVVARPSTGFRPTRRSRVARGRTGSPRRQPEAEPLASRTRSGGRPASPTYPGEPRRTKPGPPLSGSETTFGRSAGTTPRGGQASDVVRALRKVRKSTTQRYYQLLSGHAAIGCFLHHRMTGPRG